MTSGLARGAHVRAFYFVARHRSTQTRSELSRRVWGADEYVLMRAEEVDGDATVSSSGGTGTARQCGVVLSVDARQRTARVCWLHRDASGRLQPPEEGDRTEVVSVYELVESADHVYRCVVRCRAPAVSCANALSGIGERMSACSAPLALLRLAYTRLGDVVMLLPSADSGDADQAATGSGTDDVRVGEVACMRGGRLTVIWGSGSSTEARALGDPPAQLNRPLEPSGGKVAYFRQVGPEDVYLVSRDDDETGGAGAGEVRAPHTHAVAMRHLWRHTRRRTAPSVLPPRRTETTAGLGRPRQMRRTPLRTRALAPTTAGPRRLLRRCRRRVRWQTGRFRVLRFWIRMLPAGARARGWQLPAGHGGGRAPSILDYCCPGLHAHSGPPAGVALGSDGNAALLAQFSKYEEASAEGQWLHRLQPQVRKCSFALPPCVCHELMGRRALACAHKLHNVNGDVPRARSGRKRASCVRDRRGCAPAGRSASR